MGKQVETEYVCDAPNCATTTTDPTEADNVEARIYSDGNPGVTKLNGVLCTNHSEILEQTLRDNFGLRSND